MEIETNLIKTGGTTYLRIPPVMLEHLKINIEDTIIIQDEKGKKGKYFSAWKKEEIEKE